MWVVHLAPRSVGTLSFKIKTHSAILSLVAFGLAVAAGGAALGGISAPDSSAAAEGEERRGLRRCSFFGLFISNAE